MNDTIHCSRSIPVSRWGYCTALILLLWSPDCPIQAQGPPGVSQAYGEVPPGHNPYGNVQQMQFPARPQYYEYLPPDRGWDDVVETPLDRFLKQAAKQTYGRVEYLNWSYSNPGQGVIGGPGKKLLDQEGINAPSYIDAARADEFDLIGITYPIRNPQLVNHPTTKVLIQVWESNPAELTDTDLDGSMYDPGEDNDLDIFPRMTNQAKSDILSGQDPNVLFTTGFEGNPSQVAVLAIGQLANTNAFKLDNTNGFRGVVGLNTNFGAWETNFTVMDAARSSFQYTPISTGLIGVGGVDGGLSGADPQVIPILVNDSMAPDIFDAAGNIVTDSNNYYLIFNDAYGVTYETQAWGFANNLFWTLHERPDRFKISSSLGFRYFDLREEMRQRGSFSVDESVADYSYQSELSADLVSRIDSNAINRIYGPQAGIRAELGDERVSFGVDAHVLLGANSNEATVLVDDLLYEGDDNFTRDRSTDFTAGFETIVDARIKLMEHVTLTVGYNFLWFSTVTRPDDNIYYNIDATAIPDADPAGPNYTYNNDVIVDKKKSSISLNGVSVGLLIDW